MSIGQINLLNKSCDDCDYFKTSDFYVKWLVVEWLARFFFKFTKNKKIMLCKKILSICCEKQIVNIIK